MRNAVLFSAAALLFSAVTAAPVNKRDVDIQTVTEIDTVVEMVTATVWVDATDVPEPYTPPAAPTTTSSAHIDHYAPPKPTTTSTQAPAPAPPAPTTTSSTPAPAPPAPPAPETTSTTPAPAPPAPTSTTPVYVAPAPTSEYVAPPPAPTTTSTPAPAPEPTTPAQPAAPTGGSSSPNGKTYSGDITYYAVGLGSCGNTNSDSEMVVAMSAALMNKATMCGSSITLSYGGVTQKATVVDTCPGCSAGSLDLSPALFKAIAPNGDGRVKDVQWWFN